MMTKNCIGCGDVATMSTGAVWVEKLQKHVVAGFCADCMRLHELGVLIIDLKPHIVEYKKIDVMEHPKRIHEHQSVYCFGVYEND